MFSRTAGTNVAAVAQPHPSQNVTTGIHKWEGKSKKERGQLASDVTLNIARRVNYAEMIGMGKTETETKIRVGRGMGRGRGRERESGKERGYTKHGDHHPRPGFAYNASSHREILNRDTSHRQKCKKYKKDKCQFCGQWQHKTEEHKCGRCAGVGHDIKDCTACELCGDITHTSSQHLCLKCGAAGHSHTNHCPIEECDELHGINEHKCGHCGQTGHETSNVEHCYYCDSHEHTSQMHPCKFCGECGHEGMASFDDTKNCMLTLFKIVRKQAKSIEKLKICVKVHESSIRFIQSRFRSACKQCKGTGEVRTGGYDSDPIYKKCPCSEICEEDEGENDTEDSE